ncbi:MAG TPA: hypothetical protein VMQ93_18965 [Novosphingobium sp.]|nr:hypothetical protein [Novosphingobium sp.]
MPEKTIPDIFASLREKDNAGANRGHPRFDQALETALRAAGVTGLVEGQSVDCSVGGRFPTRRSTAAVTD